MATLAQTSIRFRHFDIDEEHFRELGAQIEGAAVIATDAVISIGIGFAKLATFGLAGVVSAQVIAIALLIGAVAFPGAFLAKRLIERLPLHVHTAILDAVVTGGGAAMMVHAFAR